MTAERLPEHEQRVLSELEDSLRLDRAFRIRWQLRCGLPRLRRHLRAVLTHTPHPLTVAFLAVLSGTLLVIGLRTSTPGIVWAFAGLWALTLVGVLRLLCPWTDRVPNDP